MKHKISALLLLTLTFFAGPVLADQWIHVRVDGGDEEQVTVNLPISLLQAAAAMIPEDVQREAELAIDDIDMDWHELMAFWNSVKDAPEATFVTVQTKDETVAVKKEGDFVLIRTTESTDRGAEVDVRFPMGVIDALLSGPAGTLDFQAALSALADYGPGNLVSIRDGDDDTTVQIWIDGNSEAR